jgi:hypothetical protein
MFNKLFNFYKITTFLYSIVFVVSKKIRNSSIWTFFITEKD